MVELWQKKSAPERSFECVRGVGGGGVWAKEGWTSLSAIWQHSSGSELG